MINNFILNEWNRWIIFPITNHIKQDKKKVIHWLNNEIQLRYYQDDRQR